MTPSLEQRRRQISRAGGATTFLVVLSATLMVILISAFIYLSMRQNTLQDSIREDALWAVYQLDREARTLAQTVDRAMVRDGLDDAGVAELGLRYDILYSRLSVLDNAKYEASLASSDGFLGARATVRERILDLAPIFDDLASSGTISRDQLGLVHARVLDLTPLTERMLTSTNTSVSAARADARAEVMRIQQASATLVLIISISIALLILNLTRQLRLTHRTTEQLESAARELSTAYVAAEAGNRAKSEFMAVMGHEIRTPLNAILGMAELLSDSSLPEQDRSGLRVITSSGQALLEVINEILDFAKIEHGDLVLENLPFDALALARDATEVVAGRADQQGTVLSVSSDAVVETVAFVSDPTRIRRVLLNLLSNAVKFTASGSIAVSITAPSQQRLRFEVVDTGIGISAEALPRLFNAFTQEDSTISRRFGGTGLGLAICKKTIEAMGGEIGVDSTLGSGSCFWFEIPVRRTDPIKTQPQVTDRQATLPRLRVLVVEDNAVNRDVARRFLEKLGQTVSLAVDGAEGVRMARDETFDLVLMDMQMPVMDGIAATRAIRAAEGNSSSRTRIVAMTANASDTDRVRCLEAGMDAFVAKPVTLDLLSRVIGASGPLDVVPDVSSARPPVDAARRDELAAAFGDDGLRELDESFFTDMADTLRALHAALAENDAETADRMLHSIKGAAANLGYVELSDFAESARADRGKADVGSGIEKRLALLASKEETAKAA